MGLKEGNLASLVRQSGQALQLIDVADKVFEHMLQALDCLAIQGIVHRDLKPENILYCSLQGQLHFQLGDFGLSNRQTIAETRVGTPLYMAPEFFESGQQTNKVDVWSLYVTILWTLDVGGFRTDLHLLKDVQEARQKILMAAADTSNQVSKIREMAQCDPEKRASAAQMLVKCFSGKRLSSPRNGVPPLGGSAYEEGDGEVAIKTSAKSREGLCKVTRAAAPAGQVRVRKAKARQKKENPSLQQLIERRPIRLNSAKLLEVQKPGENLIAKRCPIDRFT